MGRTECSFDYADLGCGCVKTSEGCPVINDKTCTDDIGTTIDGTSLKKMIRYMKLQFPTAIVMEDGKMVIKLTTRGTWSNELNSS